MKRKVLCIALALLLCMMVALPTFADGEADTPPERAGIIASFGLKQVSGSTYKMWARLNNPTEATVHVTLTLYGSSYNYVASVSKTSSYILITLNKNVNLSSGTYHLRLSYLVDGATYAFEKTYPI